ERLRRGRSPPDARTSCEEVIQSTCWSRNYDTATHVNDPRLRRHGPARAHLRAAAGNRRGRDQRRRAAAVLHVLALRHRCDNWTCSLHGRYDTAQTSMRVGPEVVEAVATQFESTAGTGMPLAERMILAMEAGQAKGGDRRWGSLQSAAIKIADPNDPGRGGD